MLSRASKRHSLLYRSAIQDEKNSRKRKKAGSGGMPLTRPYLYDTAMKRLPVVEVLGRCPSAQLFYRRIYAHTYRLFHGSVTVAP